MRLPRRSLRSLLAMTSLALSFSSCRQGMYDQAKYEPFEGSTIFEDGRSARPLLPDTRPQGQAEWDDARWEGRVNNVDNPNFPVAVDRALLDRGRERYDIYC